MDLWAKNSNLDASLLHIQKKDHCQVYSHLSGMRRPWFVYSCALLLALLPGRSSGIFVPFSNCVNHSRRVQAGSGTQGALCFPHV